MTKTVVFDHRTDENQLPIEDPIQIEGDLKETPSTFFSFDKNGRVNGRRKTTPIKFQEDRRELVHLAGDRFQGDYSLEFEEYKPQTRRYKFDVEISGRHRDRYGELSPLSKDCGRMYKKKPKLYKNFEANVYIYHKSRCTRQNCPVCFRKHAEIRGKTIANKLWSMIKANDVARQKAFPDWKFKPMRLRHYVINRREFEGLPVDPPDTFEEIKRLENFIKAKLKFYHNSDLDGKLGYTLVIHPYSSVKYCKRCGEEVKSVKETRTCPNCKNDSFEGGKWVRGWHWHVITNFWTNNFDGLDVALSKEKMHIQHLSKGKGYPFKRIHSEEILGRLISYELGHAMYVPYKARDVCRFFGQFHHGKYDVTKKKVDIVKLHPKTKTPYIQVKVVKVYDIHSLGITFDTDDIIEYDDNGQPQYYFDSIDIIDTCVLKNEEEYKEQFVLAGSKKKEKKI